MYERGFWKSGESRKAELDVLNSSEADEAQVDGIIEDDEDVEQASSETSSRYVRFRDNDAQRPRLDEGTLFHS